MKKRKQLIVLITALAFLIGCQNAPFRPTGKSPVGTWGGTSTVIYIDPAYQQIELTVDIYINFSQDGTFEYHQYTDGRALPPIILYHGTFRVQRDSVILYIEYDFIYPSPMQLEGAFSIELTNSSLHMDQVVGQELPVTHRLRLVPWATVEPRLPFLGYWEGMSTVTYPGPADEPISDSLEVQFFFRMDGTHSFGALGDSLSDPFIIEGTYVLEPGTIFLDFPYEILTRHPLYLKGGFAYTIQGDSLELLQQPPGFWVDVYRVRLVRRYLWYDSR